jgi:hypothetical protein
MKGKINLMAPVQDHAIPPIGFSVIVLSAGEPCPKRFTDGALGKPLPDLLDAGMEPEVISNQLNGLQIYLDVVMFNPCSHKRLFNKAWLPGCGATYDIVVVLRSRASYNNGIGPFKNILPEAVAPANRIISTDTTTQ